jgi:hypothetical protein
MGIAAAALLPQPASTPPIVAANNTFDAKPTVMLRRQQYLQRYRWLAGRRSSDPRAEFQTQPMPVASLML